MRQLPLLVLLSCAGAGSSAAQEPVDVTFYETRVRPLLSRHCGECHAAGEQRAALRVDSKEGLLTGGERGPALVPGDPEASLLVRAVRYDEEDLQMPPRSRLAPEEVEVLERWVAAGAPAPDAEMVAEVSGERFDFEERARHWAYQPVADPPVPEVRAPERVRDPIDAFVQARLDRAGLEPAPEADRRTLLRRLSFDLTGLPPTTDELEAFLADEAPGAYERQVDRLLASARFGETWARHWLDLVRFAETRGHEFDYVLPNAFQYRDYVIRAWNADVPYDRFVAEHVAGDLLEEPRPHPEEGYDESPLGTAFWFLGEEVHSPVDVRGDQVERTAGSIDVFSKTFLAQTVACARCHDHKFDPIPQDDYYALAGFLESSTFRQVALDRTEQRFALRRDLRRARGASTLEDPRRELFLAMLRESTTGFAQRLTQAYTEWRARVDTKPAEGEEEEEPPAPGPLSLEVERADADPTHPLHPYVKLRQSGALARDFVEIQRGKWRGAYVRAKKLEGSIDRLFGPDLALGTGELSRLVPFGDDTAKKIGKGYGCCDACASYGDEQLESCMQQSFETVRAGQWRLPVIADPLAPFGRLFPADAVVWDPLWDRLWTAQGERYPGAVSWPQAFRTLRTPTFRLERPRVALRVRGRGHVAAILAGHRLVQGPLHGAAVERFDTHDQVGWVTLDLEDYVGETVHLEISARTGEWLEVREVIACEEVPPARAVDARVGGLLNERGLSSKSLAQGYEALFAELTASFDGRRMMSDELLAWYLSHGTGVTLGEPANEAEGLRFDQPIEAGLAPAICDVDARDAALLVRGSHHAPRDPVPRRTLSVLGGARVPEDEPGSGRRLLAETLTDPSNPLVARVQVNRLWKHLFGRGLVATVDDFGRMGEEPSHPALLDHLATRFVAGGWSNKALLRAMVTSATYRQASTLDPAAPEIDPTGALLAAARVRRLEAEKIRDALLFVAGSLDETRFGPSVPIHLTDFLDGRGRPGQGPLDGNGRRSIYLSVRRNFPDAFLTVFDRPTPMTTVGGRSVSNVPAQALALMNDPFVLEQARRWAERSEPAEGAASSATERIDRMVQEAFARPATQEELDRIRAYVQEESARSGATPEDPEVWAGVAHVLFNAKEFVFLD